MRGWTHPNLIGQALSHFQITAKPGEGGMGEVPLAEETHMIRKLARRVLVAWVLVLWSGAPTLARDATVTAFVNVHVVPMDTERVLSDQNVIVEGEQIVAVGPSIEVGVPAGAEVIEGGGA